MKKATVNMHKCKYIRERKKLSKKRLRNALRQNLFLLNYAHSCMLNTAFNIKDPGLDSLTESRSSSLELYSVTLQQRGASRGVCPLVEFISQ